MSELVNVSGFVEVHLQTLCQRWVITLLHFLWQGTLIGGAVVLMNRHMCQRSAATRYRLLCLVLFGIPLCVAITFSMLRVPSHEGASYANRAIFPADSTSRSNFAQKSIGNLVENSISSAEASPAMSTTQTRFGFEDRSMLWAILFPWLIVGYLMGVGYFFARLLISMWGGHRLRNDSVAIEEPSMITLVNELARQAELKLAPIVAWCDGVAVPTVIGVLRPAILLPAHLVTGLDSQQLAAVISHEIAHIRRHDLWVNLAQRVIESLLFFHPAVWYVSRCLSDERESCCDDLVVSSGHDRLNYAGTLLRVAELCAAQIRQPAGTLAVSGRNVSQLEKRVTRLMSPERRSGFRFNRGGAIAFTVLLVLTLLAPVFVHRFDASTDAIPTEGQSEEDEPKGTIAEVMGENSSKTKDDRRQDSSTFSEPATPNKTDENSLRNVVRRINQEVKNIPATSSMQPLKTEDVLSAIRNIDRPKTVKQNAPPNWLSLAEYETLTSILKTNRLPENVAIRNFSRYCDGTTMQHGSWVRLMFQRESAGPFCLAIRSNLVFVRPITFIERHHRDSHTVLIGRLITYFQTDPKFGANPPLSVDYEPLQKSVKAAILKKDLDALKQLFQAEETNANSTRQAAIAELQGILKRDVRDVTFLRRGFRGDLFHWQAGKTFGPNLPVEGYMRIDFVDNDAESSNSIHLEVGAKDGRPRLVHYVVKSDRLKTGTKLSGHASISGFYVQTANGGLESGVNITAPTELKELEQANRELWLERPKHEHPVAARLNRLLQGNQTEQKKNKDSSANSKNKIGSVFGKPVFQTDLNPNVSPKDNLLTLFIQPLTSVYLKRHPKIDPEAELKKRIKDPGRRSAALMFLRMHRLHKHLYEKHGGRVALSAFGPFAIDAQAKWLTNLEKTGDFELSHPPLRAALERLKTVDDAQLLATPEQITEVFDPKMSEQFIRNLNAADSK